MKYLDIKDVLFPLSKDIKDEVLSKGLVEETEIPAGKCYKITRYGLMLLWIMNQPGSSDGVPIKLPSGRVLRLTNKAVRIGFQLKRSILSVLPDGFKLNIKLVINGKN